MTASAHLWRGRFQRDAFLLLAIQTCYRISGFALVAVLSRCLPAHDIGVYFFAVSFAEAFALLASFRLNAVLLRRIAADPAQAATHFAATLGVRLCSSPLYILCVSLAAWLFTGQIWLLVTLVGVCTLLEQIYFAYGHLFLALRRADYDAAISIVVQTGFLGIFLLGMWWFPSLAVLVGANLVRGLALVGVALLLTHYRICPLRCTWDSSLIKEGAPFLVMTVLFVLREKLDTVLLGFFTDYETVGHYQMACRAVVTSFFVPIAIGQALFPQLAAQGLHAPNRRLLVRGAAGLLVLGLLGMVGMRLYAAPITRILYGPQAPDVVLLLRPLTLLFPLGFVLQFFSLALQALHHEAKALQASAIATGVQLLGNCLLLPLWGVYGVVYSGVFATALQFTLLSWHVWKLLQRPDAGTTSPRTQRHARNPLRHPSPHPLPRQPAPRTAPMLSVIVPVHNSTAYLHQCLTALAASHYHDFEVIVVDDGSTVPIDAVVKTYGFRALRLATRSGPAQARNYGATQASGRYLVFIDADVCVHTDTLARFAAAFAHDPGLDAIVGSYDETPAAPNFLSQYKNLLHHYVHQCHTGPLSTFWSGCGAIRRELFLDCGGFDARRYRRPAIEDIELGAWLSVAGRRLTLDRRITATHLKRWTFQSLLQADILDRGIPWVRLMWRMGALASTLNVTPSQRLSVALVYILSLTLLLGAWWPACWWGTGATALLLTYLNRALYRYMGSRRGLGFALRVVPMHWLYFLYCGLCVVIGSYLHYRSKEASVERRSLAV